MTLRDPILTKTYRNRRKLFERDLDNLKRSTELAFSIINLNLTQLQKDSFTSAYEFNNDGDQSLATSLEERINNLASGGSPIAGTSSATFVINSSGNAATITTVSLTDSRTFSFPDVSGTFVLLDATQTLTNKTLTTPQINDTSADHQYIFAVNELSADRTVTLPLLAGNDVFVFEAFTQTLTNKTLTAPTIADFTNMIHDHLDTDDGGTLSASAIVSGTFADVRIAASNVTQHQAALTIAESQITDGSLLARVGGNETITGTWTFSNEIILPDVDPPTANRLNRNGIVKAWAQFSITGSNTGTLNSSYNVSGFSVTSYVPTITLDTDFATDEWAVVGSTNGGGGGTSRSVAVARSSDDEVQVFAYDGSGGNVSANWNGSIIAIGAQ